MKKLLFLSVILISICSCKSNTEKTPVVESKFNLPALPAEIYQKLFNEATYVDYIFYNLPFAVSQDNRPSIQSNVLMISQEKMAPLPISCKAMGREFFHFDGAIEYEADLYYDDGCAGYVFLVDGKPTYANNISSEGKKFYNNLIAQASKIQNQGFNGQ